MDQNTTRTSTAARSTVVTVPDAAVRPSPALAVQERLDHRPWCVSSFACQAASGPGDHSEQVHVAAAIEPLLWPVVGRLTPTLRVPVDGTDAASEVLFELINTDFVDDGFTLHLNRQHIASLVECLQKADRALANIDEFDGLQETWEIARGRATPEGRRSSSTMLTIPEAAAQLAVPESWLRAQVSDHAVPFAQLGTMVRFSQDDLDAIITHSRTSVG